MQAYIDTIIPARIPRELWHQTHYFLNKGVLRVYVMSGFTQSFTRLMVSYILLRVS